jgi:pentatricopeptide repeat protein
VASNQQRFSDDRSNHPAPPRSLNTKDTVTPESRGFKGFQPLKKTSAAKPTTKGKKKAQDTTTTTTTDTPLNLIPIRQRVLHYQQHGFPSQLQNTPQWLQQLALCLAEPLSFPFDHEPSKSAEVFEILPLPSCYNPPPDGDTDTAPDNYGVSLNSSTIQQQEEEVEQQQDLPDGNKIKDKGEGIFSSELSSILEHHRGKVATSLGIGNGGIRADQQGSDTGRSTQSSSSSSSSSSSTSSFNRIDARSLRTLYKLLASIGGYSLPMTLWLHLHDRNGVDMLVILNQWEKEKKFEDGNEYNKSYINIQKEAREGRWTYPLYNVHCIGVILRHMVIEDKGGVDLGVEFFNAILEHVAYSQGAEEELLDQKEAEGRDGMNEDDRDNANDNDKDGNDLVQGKEITNLLSSTSPLSYTSTADDILVVGRPGNPRPWILLLESAAEKGRPDLASKLLLLIYKYKQPILAVAYALYILAYTKAGDADGAKKAYQAMVDSGIGPVSAALRAVVEALCQHGRLEEGLELFQREVLPQPHPAHNGVYQTICFHLMIQGRKEEAVGFLKHAQQHRILFGENVMLQMNEACRKANRFDVLFDWFTELRNLGIIYGVPAFMNRNNNNNATTSDGEDGSSDGDSSFSSSSFAHPSWRGRKSRSRKASAKNYRGRLRPSFISDSHDDAVLDSGFTDNNGNGNSNSGGGNNNDDVLTREPISGSGSLLSEIRPAKMSTGANAALSYERAMYFLQHGGHSEQALLVFSWMTQDGLVPRSSTCRIAFEVYASLGKAKEAWELYITLRREGISLSYTEFINVLTALIADVSLPRNPFTKRASPDFSPPLSVAGSDEVGHSVSNPTTTAVSSGAAFGFNPSPAVVRKLEEAVRVPETPQAVWNLSFPKRSKWKKLEPSSSGERDVNSSGTTTTSEPDNNDAKPPPSNSNSNKNNASPLSFLLEKTTGALSLRWPLVLALIHDYHTLFPKMRETHLETIAISAAAKRGWVGGGDAVYKLMLQDGVQPKVQTFNALIMGCSRVKNARKALAYFEVMQAMQTMPDVYTCTTLLDTCGAGRKLISAQKLWKWMVTFGIPVDMFCLNSAMRCFLDCQRPDLALAGLEQAIHHSNSATNNNKGTSSPSPSSSVTFGDLCTVLGKHRQWKMLKLSNELRSWVQYQLGPEKDPRMLTRSDIVTMLTSSEKNKNNNYDNSSLSWNDILAFFDTVVCRCPPPLGGAYRTTDSNSGSRGSSSSEDGSGGGGGGGGGEGNFAEFLPDALTYSYWINACYHTGDLRKTLKLRTKAAKGGFKISSDAFLSCLLAESEYKRDNKIADCMAMLEALREGGYPVDAYTLTTLIATVCRKKSNGIEEAHKLLDHWMTSSSSSSSSPGDQQQQMPTKFMLSSLLSVHANQGGARSGLDLFYNMESTYNVKPDEISFNIVLDGLGKSGLWEEGIELVLYGMKNGLCPPSFLPASKGGLSAGYFNNKEHDADKDGDGLDDSANGTTTTTTSSSSSSDSYTTSTPPPPPPSPPTRNGSDIVTSFGVSSVYARERRARRMAAAAPFPTPFPIPAGISPITPPINIDSSDSTITKTTPSTKSNGNSHLMKRIDILDLHNFAVHSAAVILRAWLLILKVQAIKGNRVDDTVRIVTGQGLSSSFPGVSKLRPVVQRAFGRPDEDDGTIINYSKDIATETVADDNDSSIEDSNASNDDDDKARVDTTTITNSNKAGWGIIGKKPLRYTLPLKNQGVIKVRPGHLYSWLMDDEVDLGVDVGSEKGMALGEELFQAAITMKHGNGKGNK